MNKRHGSSGNCKDWWITTSEKIEKQHEHFDVCRTYGLCRYTKFAVSSRYLTMHYSKCFCFSIWVDEAPRSVQHHVQGFPWRFFSNFVGQIWTHGSLWIGEFVFPRPIRLLPTLGHWLWAANHLVLWMASLLDSSAQLEREGFVRWVFLGREGLWVKRLGCIWNTSTRMFNE